MTVALVLDFPGGTKEQYDEVVERMELSGGHMPPGGVRHFAGHYADGWRVIDIWEDIEHFARFRDEQIAPHTQAVGLMPPEVRVIDVDEEKLGSGEPTTLVQCVILRGLGRDSFHAADDVLLPGGQPPEALTFHVNGPIDGGWCVIDGWTSKEARDEFIDARVRPAMENAPLQGPPQIEDLLVEASMGAGATARA